MQDDQNEPTEEEGVSDKDSFLLNSSRAELIALNYLDHDGFPIGPGKHLIPLLIETLKISRAISDYLTATFSDDESAAAKWDPESVFKSFYIAQTDAMAGLRADGYEQVEDLVFELIFPHMNWNFCLQYSNWMALMSAFDMLDRDIRAFDGDHPDGVIFTLRTFHALVKEKGAKWSIKIAEKALARLWIPSSE